MSYKLDAQLAPAPTTRRGYRCNLNCTQDEKKLIYSHGRSVILRDVNDPNIFEEVVKNRCEVSACVFSPSGNYVASGDVKGNVFVWATDDGEHNTKYEYQPLSGRINDISWDNSNGRLAVVGEGREKLGSVVLLSTQSSIGSISSHSKAINSVSYCQSKKAKLIVTASDDISVSLNRGAPFKVEKIINDHSKFVNCVKFYSDTCTFASCGADGIVNIYDASDSLKKICTLNTAFGEKPTGGTLYCLDWSDDGTKLIASSASCVTYLWDVETQKIISVLKGPETCLPKDQHLSCLYLKDRIITLSLSQEINYYDLNTYKPFTTIRSHKGPVSTVFKSASSEEVYSAGAHTVVNSWIPNSSYSVTQYDNPTVGDISIVDMVPSPNGIYFATNSDHVSYLDSSSKKFIWTIPIPGRPSKILYDSQIDSCIALIGDNTLCAIQNERISRTVKIEHGITTISFSPDCQYIALGLNNNTVRIYEYNGDISVCSQKEKITLKKNMGTATAISFSPTANQVLVGNSSGKIILYDVETGMTIGKQWDSHSSRINCISWSKDSKYVATASLDTSIEIWPVDNPKKHITIKPAHAGSVNRLDWYSDNKIVSVGHDGMVKVISDS